MRHVVGFPGYAVSSTGQLWSCRRKKHWLKCTPTLSPRGYHKYGLRRDGRYKFIDIHRLVLETFAGPCPDGCEGTHLDGNPRNNSINNLQWRTHADNMNDQIIHGTRHGNVGTHNGNAKLTERDVVTIRRLIDKKLMNKDIAAQFNIDPSIVSGIRHKRIWRHV